MSNCSRCGGTGQVDCPNCGGTKMERGSGNPCNECDYAGRVACPQCGGSSSSSSRSSSGKSVKARILKELWDMVGIIFKQ
jgi:hypothetical protein